MRREPIELDCNALLLRAVQLLESIDRRLAAAAPIPDDPAAVLLRALAGFVGVDVAFSAAEVFERANDPLRAALGDLDTLGLGYVLRENKDRDIGGLRLGRVGRDLNGAVWTFIPA